MSECDVTGQESWQMWSVVMIGWGGPESSDQCLCRGGTKPADHSLCCGDYPPPPAMTYTLKGEEWNGEADTSEVLSLGQDYEFFG